MKTLWLFAGIACAALATAPASAGPSTDDLWLPPQKKQCSLEPNQDCGIDFKCPAKTPYLLSGGGGLSKVSDDAHNLAMTMNVAISKNTWRVRWRNMGDKKVDVTVMVRVMCAED